MDEGHTMLTRKATADQYERSHRANLNALADALGVERIGPERSADRCIQWAGQTTDGNWLRISTTTTADSVDMDVSGIPLAVALAICRLVQGPAFTLFVRQPATKPEEDTG